jgi:hypothetical protein
MADVIPTTLARAAETAHFDLDPALLAAVSEAFALMVECLAQLCQAEEAAAPCWADFPGTSFDWASLERIRDAAMSAAQEVLAHEAASPGDRDLKATAVLVRLTLSGMDAPMDRPAERRSIEEAARRLVLPGSDAGAERTNAMLRAAFALLRRLSEIAEANASAAHLETAAEATAFA